MDIKDMMEVVDIMEIRDIMAVMNIMDIMDIMDIIDIMDIMDIMIITAWLAMAGAVSALVLFECAIVIAQRLFSYIRVNYC